MDVREHLPNSRENGGTISAPESLSGYREAFNSEKDRTSAAASKTPAAEIADGFITFGSKFAKKVAEAVHDDVREINQIFNKRDIPEDKRRDRTSVQQELANKELEAGINQWTLKVLMKDADLYPPVNNEDGSTTYKVMQFGLTNRPIDSSEQATSAKYYSRAVDVTVPPTAKSLGECTFDRSDRVRIDQAEFDRLLDRDRSRLKQPDSTGFGDDVVLHAHGVFTYTDMADQEAILLQLTNGHPLVAVDWQAFPNTREHPHHISLHDPISKLYLHYMEDRSSAKQANVQMEPLIDHAIEKIAPEHTTMIGFSHGGMFDSRYLRHRVENHMPKIAAALYTHPDVELRAPELNGKDRTGTDWLLPEAADRSFVIGGRTDMALMLARWLPGAFGERLGDDHKSTRHTIEIHEGAPVSEVARALNPPNDEHFINYAGIASILNGDAMHGEGRSEAEIQEDYRKATEASRAQSGGN